MATPYSNIFNKYGVLVEDAELLSILDVVEYEGLLTIFLSKATNIYFKTCLKDLSNVDNVLKQFNQSLTEEEQWILAEGMKLVWYEKQIFKEKQFKDRIGSKDYITHSPANLIDKLVSLRNDTEKSLRNKIVDYTFNGFSGFN